jgi:hypothetical protein
LGYSTHDIRPRTDPISPINDINRVQTCSNQGGVQVCHPSARAKFASGRVHAYGTKAQILAGKQIKEFEDQEIDLVLERAEADISKKELFHFKVIQLIKLFYKIFIGVTILFMALHQWLDFISAKRNAKTHRDGV